MNYFLDFAMTLAIVSILSPMVSVTVAKLGLPKPLAAWAYCFGLYFVCRELGLLEWILPIIFISGFVGPLILVASRMMESRDSVTSITGSSIGMDDQSQSDQEPPVFDASPMLACATLFIAHARGCQ